MHYDTAGFKGRERKGREGEEEEGKWWRKGERWERRRESPNSVPSPLPTNPGSATGYCCRTAYRMQMFQFNDISKVKMVPADNTLYP